MQQPHVMAKLARLIAAASPNAVATATSTCTAAAAAAAAADPPAAKRARVEGGAGGEAAPRVGADPAAAEPSYLYSLESGGRWSQSSSPGAAEPP